METIARPRRQEDRGIQYDIKSPMRFLFAGQLQHIILLACLLPGGIYLALPALDGATWLGITDSTWFYVAILVAVVHQIVGWFVLRMQLVFSLFTRLFGRYDLAVWGGIFFLLFILRPISVTALGLADFGSLEPLRGLQIVLGLILLVPVVYTGWSIERYFGVPRALGGDHFRPQYREMPLVKEGAFKYSSNAMYTFAFLLFWAIALLTGSRAALAAALFQHAYIWVHMYCTEAPDMQVIYGKYSEPIRG
ncbi:MAG: phosphatidylethanolamine N-methyltransferase family protein [Chloroflexales bacterium]|nr:phosphatidylethanolamine N-methyltransferase family protein [Chloroflexales bacterium]